VKNWINIKGVLLFSTILKIAAIFEKSNSESKIRNSDSAHLATQSNLSFRIVVAGSAEKCFDVVIIKKNSFVHKTCCR
jgi:hypothetical protein